MTARPGRFALRRTLPATVIGSVAHHAREGTMIERRSVIGGFTTALAAGAVLGSGRDVAAAQATQTAKLPSPIRGPRINFAQADKVMSELGLDAILVSTGTNLYHATGLDLTETRMGLAPGVFAVI